MLAASDVPQARGPLCGNSEFALNVRSENVRGDSCELPFVSTGRVSPFNEEDIARVTLAHVPAETLLVVRGISRHLCQVVNEEAAHRLSSDSADCANITSSLIKAMHGAFACRKHCRNLKTVLLMQQKQAELSSTPTCADEDMSALCLCAVYGTPYGTCTHCLGA